MLCYHSLGTANYESRETLNKAPVNFCSFVHFLKRTQVTQLSKFCKYNMESSSKNLAAKITILHFVKFSSIAIIITENIAPDKKTTICR